MDSRRALILPLCLLFLTGCSLFVKRDTQTIFARLDEEAARSDWGSDHDVKAKIFEGIYVREKGRPDFEALLFRYLDSDDKYYWIGIFLCEPDYTRICDVELALRVLKKGLETRSEEEHTTRYCWIVAKLLYDHSRREESRSWFRKARELSMKYPGNKPAWTAEEDREIWKFNGWPDPDL